MNSILRLSFFLPAVLAPLSAQAPENLIGLTRTQQLRQIRPQNCQPLGDCPTNLPISLPVPPYAGGTAWDPVRSGAWVSNGRMLGKYSDACTQQCPPIQVPVTGINDFVTGLELVESLNQLWLIDSSGRLVFLSNTCPPNVLGACNTGLGQTPLGNVTSGLAVDDENSLVFIAYPVFPFGANTIVVTSLQNPCQPLQQIQVPPCPNNLGPLTGLACDWGKRILYATDGLHTVAIQYVPAAIGIGVIGVTCCPSPGAADPLVGLAVRPGKATSLGQPCANGSCLPCPMNHRLRNDPVLGNLQFSLGLDQAQPNQFAFCLIGAGSCVPVGLGTPPLCGPILTVPYIGYLGANTTGGGTALCDGTATFTLPLPIIPGLAGQVFSSQCLTICFSPAVPGFGTSLSNCLSFELQGS